MTDDLLCAGADGLQLLTQSLVLRVIGRHVFSLAYFLDSVLREGVKMVGFRIILYSHIHLFSSREAGTSKLSELSKLLAKRLVERVPSPFRLLSAVVTRLRHPCTLALSALPHKRSNYFSNFLYV